MKKSEKIAAFKQEWDNLNLIKINMGLTKKEDQIYKKLVQEYNREGYEKICSLDTFLKNKWENEKNGDKASVYYQIWWYAANDF